MAKYTSKIKNITQLVHLPEIQTRLKHDNLKTNQSCVQFINRIITAAQNNNTGYKQTEEYLLPAIHPLHDPPLAAVLYAYVYSNNDFNAFVAWYRQNQSVLTTSSYFGNHPIHDVYEFMHNPSEKRRRLHKLLYDNRFISLDVQHYAESVDLIYKCYTINDNDILHLFIQQDETFVELEELCNVFATMHKLVPQNNKPITLTILYSPQKKLATWKHFSVFCTDNINSGMTLPNEYVCCWRKEELLKVVTHELVHFFMLDHASTATLNIGKIDGIDFINEAYTETLATVIRSVMISQKTKTDFLDIFAEEIIFSLFQTAKLIVLSGGQTWSDFAEKRIIMRQTTSVRSYFIIKTMLLCDIKNFIVWLNGNLKLPSDEKYVDFLHRVFDKFNKNNFLITKIDTFCKLLSCMTEEEQKRFVVSTCRMTAH